jgi:hypothetical protein
MKSMQACLAALALLAVSALPALAQTTYPPAAGCTLAGCTLSYTANGIQSQVKTYKYTSLGNTPAATPTDIFTISGSASKTIRITKIVVGGAASTAGDLNPIIVHRSTANTGGSPTNPTPVPRDAIADSTATATLALYTANPATTGTVAGNWDSCRLFLQVTTTGAPDVCSFTYGVNDDQLPVLHGAGDYLAINFAGATLPSGAIVDIDVEWTEDP